MTIHHLSDISVLMNTNLLSTSRCCLSRGRVGPRTARCPPRALALARLCLQTTRGVFSEVCVPLGVLFFQLGRRPAAQSRVREPQWSLSARRPRAGLRRELDTGIAAARKPGAIEILRT